MSIIATQIDQGFGAVAKMKKNERLQVARQSAGFDTPTEAARALGVPVATYSHHESGERGFKEASGQKYARRFQVNFVWLMHGLGEMKDASLKASPKALPEIETIDAQQIETDGKIRNTEVFEESFALALEILSDAKGSPDARIDLPELSAMVKSIYKVKMDKLKGK